MRFKRLKRAAVSVMCGALLLSGSGACDLKVSAEENDTVYEEDIDVLEASETDCEDVTEDAEELVEDENIYGITAAIDKARVSTPGTAGLLWLWPNDFFNNKSVKTIKSGTYYNGDENTKYPGHAEYEYNDKGQLAKCTHSVNAGESNYREEFEYYPNGDLKSIKKYGGYKVTDINNASLASLEEFEYEYDSTGKCIKEKYYYTDYSDSAEEWKGKIESTSTYEYDANGNCIKENDDYYDVIKLYEYDTYGNCIKKSTQNEKGYIERVDEYNAEGYVIKETHYDSNGNSTGGAVNDYKYEYDADGDVVKITKTMHYLDDDTIFTAIFKYDYYPKGSIPKYEKTNYSAMYRLYNPNSGEHFYTANVSERDKLVNVGWRYEGIAWYAPVTSNTPVYRLYNPNAGDHHYTTSAAEKDKLVKVGWKYEGIGWYSTATDGQPLYRLYNPNAKAGAHHYTTSAAERDNLKKLGWRDEGIAWYGGK